MILLALDTTTSAGSAALLENRRILAEFNMQTPLSHSERILPAVDALLKVSGLTIQEVDAFAVTVGPGSFTGIRIGLGTVKSLALASGKPVAPVSSLLALAFKHRHPGNRLVCPILDARKQEVYGALFRSSGEGLEEIIPQGVYRPDALFSRIPRRRMIQFIGSGTDAYGELIRSYFRDRARFSGRSPFTAHEIGLIGYRTLRAGGGQSPQDVQPLYFRRSQAEEGH